MRKLFLIMLLIVSVIILTHSYLLYMIVVKHELFEIASKEYLVYFSRVQEPVEEIWYIDMCLGSACCVAGFIFSFLAKGLGKWVFVVLFTLLPAAYFLASFA